MDKRWYGRLRCVIANFIYRFSTTETKAIINADIDRYMKNTKFYKENPSYVKRLDYLLLDPWQRPYRNIFYYRVKYHPTLCHISRWILPDVEGVELDGKFGPGLVLSHNHMVVHPEVAGKNFRVGPGAVVGKSNGKYPTIGDNVFIAANATVIGGITIGDNVIVASGAVVTKDLEGNGVYAGCPAKLLRHIDDDERLLGIIIGTDL